MSKKRSYHKKSRQSHNRHQHPSLELLEKNILVFLYDALESATINTIVKAIALSRSSKDDIKTCLSRMVKNTLLIKSGKNSYSLKKNIGLFEAILDKNPRGFGFATHLSSNTGQPSYKKDPYIAKSRMNTANHGDRILIRILRVRSDGYPEAEVLKVLQRGVEQLVGIFISDETIPYVIPEDPRFPFEIHLPQDQYKIAENGDAVLVKILYSQERAAVVQGSVIEVLGSMDNIDVQMRMVIEKFRLPHRFDEKTILEAEKLSEETPNLEHRSDLRDIAHVTIDGETAKDFDDAIAVVKTRKGFRLYVSIADVSHFVSPGSALDKEAYKRGTSIYFPGRVIPMLPERLSNDLCSLVPGKDKLTFTATLDFDRTGNRTSKTFCKSIICSRKRFTYTTVKKILVDKDAPTRRDHKEFLTPLKWAEELARELSRRRMQRGSIGFNIPEAEISLDEKGGIASIKRAERNFAHQIIEEFMLAANEAVAETFTSQKKPALYRIHERPDPEKVSNFRELAKAIGLELPPGDISPEWFGHVLDMAKDSPKEYVVNNLLLRTMQQARYSPDNVGHFGLAANDYTHFTSPIRRYPDLLVHRALFALITPMKKNEHSSSGKQVSLSEAGQFLSSRERIAIDAEREMNDRLKTRFMEKHIGETFDAVVSGVSNYAFFVELLNLFVSGSVSVAQLTDDYYLFDIKHQQLIGEITARTYQIGQLLRVTVHSIDKSRNRINFLPV